VDSSCLIITLKRDLANNAVRTRSAPRGAATRDCKAVNFVEVRFVVTVRQIIEKLAKGQSFGVAVHELFTDC